MKVPIKEELSYTFPPPWLPCAPTTEEPEVRISKLREETEGERQNQGHPLCGGMPPACCGWPRRLKDWLIYWYIGISKLSFVWVVKKVTELSEFSTRCRGMTLTPTKQIYRDCWKSDAHKCFQDYSPCNLHVCLQHIGCDFRKCPKLKLYCELISYLFHLVGHARPWNSFFE